MTDETERLREAIRRGEIVPRPDRDQVAPDPRCPWEWAVSRIYEAERAAEVSSLRGGGGMDRGGQVTEQAGWVIEGAWSETSRPDYWVGSSAWSTDHMKALRFARKQDAQQAADLMLDGINYRICEHVWIESRLPASAPVSLSKEES